MWKIFDLCDKNILQKICAIHKSLTQHSHSRAHMIVALHQGQWFNSLT
jgi:hypothetical protein